MIELDGSFGEGGGAILRVSVGLAAALRKPVKVVNIRARRANPGLRPQHLNAILACAELTGGEVSGANEGSKEIIFTPGEELKTRLKVSVGTAGSVTLVLQALMIPLSLAKKETVVEVSGGTDVSWSPPVDYLKNVTLPILGKFGFDANLEILRRGYFPAGGGKIIFTVKPAEKKPIELLDGGRLLSVRGISHAHTELKEKNVSERQETSARKALFEGLSKLVLDDVRISLGREYSDAASFGSGITLWAEFENTTLGADSLGEKGKRAEDVGREAAESLLSQIKCSAPVDEHMADQIIPYIALMGGRVRIPTLTGHAKTNIWVAQKFSAKISCDRNLIHAEQLKFT